MFNLFAPFFRLSIMIGMRQKGRTDIQRELGDSVNDFRVELIGHSVYARAGEHQPIQKGQPAITWRSVSGGEAEELIKITKVCAAEEKEAGFPTIFLLAIFQNSIAHDRDLDEAKVTKLLQEVTEFFSEDLHNYHKFAWINVLPCPELVSLGHAEKIKMINTLLGQANVATGQRACDPGKTLEKKKFALRNIRNGNGEKTGEKVKIERTIVLKGNWREYNRGYGPGYHPDSVAMPTVVSYIRNWVKHYKF